MSQLITFLGKFNPDDFNKVVLAIVALISLIVAPIVQFAIARRQLRTQEALAKRQLDAQEQIAARQLLLQQQLASRQIADSISSRRQVWIDEIRKDVSEMVTLFGRVGELRHLMSQQESSDQKKTFGELSAAQLRGHELSMRVRLRLNPGESKHNDFVDLMRKLGDSIGQLPPDATPGKWAASQELFAKVRAEVIQHLQGILKDEWERIKRGEV
ncbi:hypothetical protein [Variovorax guangxiensis]|uniref:Type II secretory pathway pseudopilin PulG n=1 Tax=Variovorax guangxiensis TaxID=1775474 RepID=A0A840FUW8_9BURK|nr:hypothetical protein [Variovorax guangxiensis]MBB4223955.1 type II secretory pathway pseudopilin PulG [Variovorax guangxiensis]